MKINMREKVGIYAENKDSARDIRLNEIIPALERKEQVILNFEGVETATQSFIHALISDVIKKFGNNALDQIEFKACNDSIKQMVSIVVEYMQEAMGNG